MHLHIHMHLGKALKIVLTGSALLLAAASAAAWQCAAALGDFLPA